ncbi:MAG TPA: MFS transporter [Candidatus Acidoferrum sp.]|nr:MFS transporter [Candidatus Acidoferrum sp.]
MVHPIGAEVRRTQIWARAGTPLGLFVTLGLTAGAVGVAWPPMRATFSAPLAGLGLILATVTVAYFAGSASSGQLGARFGGGVLITAGCALAAVGLIAVSLATHWLMIPILGLVLGVGFGLIDAAVNTHVSLNRGIRYMGWLHASWATGAALGPQIVVVSLALTRSWRPAFAIMGSAFVAFGIVIGLQRQGRTQPAAGLEPSSARPAPITSYRRVIILLAALLLLAAGLEATAGDWSYTELTLGRSMMAVLASWGATLFWAGLAAGRVALGMLGNRIPPDRLLDASMAISAGATLAFWLSPPLVAAVVALPLLGMAVSVVFPLLLSLTPTRVGAAMTGHAVGYALAAGTIGGGALPAAVGLALQTVGLSTLGPMMTAIATALLLLHIVSRRSPPRSARPGRDPLAM